MEEEHGVPGQLARTDRRTFLLRTLVAASSSLINFSNPLKVLAQSRPLPDLPAVPIARTRDGRVRGVRENDVLVFKGIPYAASPTGRNRFKAPHRVKPWAGVRDALAYGTRAMQPLDPNVAAIAGVPPSSEDCQFLNVWTPSLKRGRKRAVMVYQHGGGFATGDGGTNDGIGKIMHDGSALARAYDVVVVTHNHRLGVLGYLYLEDLLGEEYAESGSAGMLDIVAVLKWVQENIEEFGGDPGNVMIWGESGGGAKTGTLTAMPAARGLFHKASIESGAALRMRTVDTAKEATRQVLSKLGLQESQARELLNVPATTLIEIQASMPRPEMTGPISGASLGFSPVVDGHFLPQHPFDPIASPFSANVPMIVGTNKDEMVLFNLGNKEVFSLTDAQLSERLLGSLGEKTKDVIKSYRRSRPNTSATELYIAITSAQTFLNSAITLAERKVAQKAAPVYMYRFDYENELPVSDTIPHPRGAMHAIEIPFKFNHPEGLAFFTGNRPERFKAARNMSAMWAAFAKSSNPNAEALPKWPAYTLERRATMIIDVECKVIDDPNRIEREAWANPES